MDYSKCRWVERRNTKLRGNRQPTSPLLVANLDIESDELDKYLSSCPVGWAIVSSELTSEINNIGLKKEISRKSKISEDIRSLDLLK